MAIDFKSLSGEKPLRRRPVRRAARPQVQRPAATKSKSASEAAGVSQVYPNRLTVPLGMGHGPLNFPESPLVLPRRNMPLVPNHNVESYQNSVSRFAGLGRQGPSSALWARETVAYAMLSQPTDSARLVEQLMRQGHLNFASYEPLANHLASLRMQGPSLPASGMGLGLSTLLEVLPAKVVLIILKERGEAIQRMLEGWAESLREQAKIAAEAQKKAQAAAHEHQRVIESRLAFLRHLNTRGSEREALSQNVVRHMRAMATAKDSFSGPAGLPKVDVIFPSIPRRVVASATGLRLGRATEIAPTAGRISESLFFAANSPYAAPSASSALTPPALAADGPSLRQPYHGLSDIIS